MLDVEVVRPPRTAGAPRADEIQELCRWVAGRFAVRAGHVAVEFVDAARIAELNARHRGREGPTDVLSFPIDGPPVTGTPQSGRTAAPRELGDVVICPEHTVDLREAVVHGMLHLLGMDHERDAGEMLALQDELLARRRQ
ncbi:MAG TPA: rRNA maturation RNase YbeY [Solirubrobacteraceae bacterium]|jgi:probable rRNA maturation factor|nr:rRNA maturation RNase YbeY [Solirubrobacteraceae bacterium]